MGWGSRSYPFSPEGRARFERDERRRRDDKAKAAKAAKDAAKKAKSAARKATDRNSKPSGSFWG
ncbi:MAG: hypothetical protein WBB33_00060 [Candidatus Saccharimonadales bacterium]